MIDTLDTVKNNNLEKVSFSIGAGLINRLGKELVGRAETAVSELIKNAYDADATIVDLIFENASFDGSAFNISSGNETTIKDVVTEFYKHLNPNLTFSFNNKQKQGDPNNWQADISALKKLGFNTAVSLNDGLLKTANWLNSL